jgi:RNA polymerase sigma-70 factor (ECF subfamily)
MLSAKEVIHQTNLAKSWRSPLPCPIPAPSGPVSSVESDRGSWTGGIACGLKDEELTALARNGHMEAFEELIQRHRGMCMRRALRILRNQSDAEDAVQSAWRRAFQCLEQFQGKGAFVAWLGRIVDNQCLMRIREERSANFVYLDNTSKSDFRLELVGQARNPEDELGREEVAKILRKEMLRMPTAFRDIMLLHDSEELPMLDVAGRLGLSVPAAKSRLLRARRELRSRIGKHCGRKGPGTLLAQAVCNRTAFASAA